MAPDDRRCIERIEKEWKGHRAVLWRKQCKNYAVPGTDRCYLHQRWWEHAPRAEGGQ